MCDEKLGIVFCTSQRGATRGTFNLSLFRQKVLDPVYELLTVMPDVWRVLCVTPLSTSCSEGEDSWHKVVSGGSSPLEVCTPTSQAVTHYTSMWPKNVCERLHTYNTPWQTPEDCMNDGVVFLRNSGATRIIVVSYGEQFPTCRHILRMLIAHCSSELMFA